MTVWVFIRDVARRFPYLLALNTFLLVVEGLMGVISVFAVVAVIDLLINPDLQKASVVTRQAASLLASAGLPVTLTSLLGVFLAFQIVQNGFAIAARHFIVRARYAVLRDLMVGTFDDLFRARWSFFTASRQGMIINTFIHEMNRVGESFQVLALLFASLLQLVFYLAVPFYLSWQVTSLSLTAGLLLAFPFLLLGKVSYRLGKQSTSSANEIGVAVQESVTLAKVIFGFGNQRRSVGNLTRAFEKFRRAMVRSQTLRVATPLVYEPLGMIVLVITLFTAQRFAVPISETAALVWALSKGIPLLGDLTMKRNSLVNHLPSYEQVRSLRRQARDMEQRSGGAAYHGFEREIAIENVTFAYPEHEPTLTNVSLRIPKGKIVAIAGESGVGKSTLIDLVMGFHQPVSGRVTVDGVALETFDIDSYRRRIGYVPQESILFHTTIRENLLWSHDTATDAEIKEACWRANAHEFIECFPDGYDTVVGDRGVRLSGGQSQRVALARAILRKPDLLILDEATSSLDSHSERLIQRAIDSIARETTVIIVTHRLSTIVNADYIYVLKGGVIVEEGTYPMLMGREGHFNRMAQLQLLETA